MAIAILLLCNKKTLRYSQHLSGVTVYCGCSEADYRDHTIACTICIEDDVSVGISVFSLADTCAGQTTQEPTKSGRFVWGPHPEMLQGHERLSTSKSEFQKTLDPKLRIPKPEQRIQVVLATHTCQLRIGEHIEINVSLSRLNNCRRRSPSLLTWVQSRSVWAWFRKQLLAKDLADLKAGMPPVGKTTLKTCVSAVCCAKKAQTIASNYVLNLRKVAHKVVKNGGRASDSLLRLPVLNALWLTLLAARRKHMHTQSDIHGKWMHMCSCICKPVCIHMVRATPEPPPGIRTLEIMLTDSEQTSDDVLRFVAS